MFPMPPCIRLEILYHQISRTPVCHVLESKELGSPYTFCILAAYHMFQESWDPMFGCWSKKAHTVSMYRLLQVNKMRLQNKRRQFCNLTFLK